MRALISNRSNVFINSTILRKLKADCLYFAYNESRISIAAALICAALLFLGYFKLDHKLPLYLWAFCFFVLHMVRFVLSFIFSSKKTLIHNYKLAYGLFVVLTLLAGVSWGAGGCILFPAGNDNQKILLALIIGGVTAGSTASLSAVREAAIPYLISALLPLVFIVHIKGAGPYLLFEGALITYLIYLIILSFQNYRRISYIFLLQYEKDYLLRKISLSNKKFKKLATHDFHTGLLNSMVFEEKLFRAIDHAKRHKKNLILMFIDIDHFKSINDTYGHNEGNKVLQRVSEMLKKNLGGADIIARLGGDEFGVIIENVVFEVHVEEVAQKLCVLVKQLNIDGKDYNLSLSIGMAMYPKNGKNSRALINVADQAMYTIKYKGGDGFHFSSEYSE